MSQRGRWMVGRSKDGRFVGARRAGAGADARGIGGAEAVATAGAGAGVGTGGAVGAFGRNSSGAGLGVGIEEPVHSDSAMFDLPGVHSFVCTVDQLGAPLAAVGSAG